MLGKLALIVGHYPGQPGALALPPISQHEFDYNKGFAQLIASYSSSYDILCQIFKRIPDIDSAYYKANSFIGLDPGCIIELHFNAGPSQARGSETLYIDKIPESKRLSVLVQGSICIALKRLGKLNRGTRQLINGDRGYMNLTKAKHPACLIEPFFGSNTEDCVLALEAQDDLAEAICISAKLYLKDDSCVPA